MVSIESWRCAIGINNLRTRNHEFRIVHTKSHIASCSTFLQSPLKTTILPAKLICILLVIGCVEINPGPLNQKNNGTLIKILQAFNNYVFHQDSRKKRKFISLIFLILDSNQDE